MAINNQATSPASAINEYTKPTLSTHIIDLFQNYAWAATGELVSDGITPFNITFASKTSACAVTCKVTKLVAMLESGGATMSYANAETFMVDESTFPANTTACSYHLEEAHSIMVDLGEAAPFTMAYQQCVQDLHSHFDLSLRVHY